MLEVKQYQNKIELSMATTTPGCYGDACSRSVITLNLEYELISPGQFNKTQQQELIRVAKAANLRDIRDEEIQSIIAKAIESCKETIHAKATEYSKAITAQAIECSEAISGAMESSKITKVTVSTGGDNLIYLDLQYPNDSVKQFLVKEITPQQFLADRRKYSQKAEPFEAPWEEVEKCYNEFCAYVD